MPKLARLQSVVGERSNSNANQTLNGMTHGATHSADLTITSFADSDAQDPRLSLSHFRGSGHPILEFDTLT